MKKKVKIFIITITVFALCFLPYTQSYAKTPNLEQIRNGVVKIVAQCGENYTMGTGFFIGPQNQPVQYLVTNYHVIQGANSIFLHRGKDDFIQLYTTNVLLPVTDIAVLELSVQLHNQQVLVLNDSRKVTVGDNVFCLGFPGASDTIDGDMSGKPEDVTITRGMIGKISTDKNNRDFLQMDASITYGNSGGPMIDENGFVIGINTFGILEENIYAAIQITELVDALNSRGFIFEKSSNYIAQSNTQNVNVANPVIPPPPKKSSRAKMYILMAIVVFGGFGGLILYTKKKKNSSKSSTHNSNINIAPQPVAENKPSTNVNAYIIGVNGAFTGKNMQIVSKIYIGRGDNCHVKFNSNTKGISSRHCSVEFDGKSFYLIDLGSTYGTFLNNGQKLNSKVKYCLNSGDRFYLASSDQLFQVSIIYQ